MSCTKGTYALIAAAALGLAACATPQDPYHTTYPGGATPPASSNPEVARYGYVESVDMVTPERRDTSDRPRQISVARRYRCASVREGRMPWQCASRHAQCPFDPAGCPCCPTIDQGIGGAACDRNALDAPDPDWPRRRKGATLRRCNPVTAYENRRRAGRSREGFRRLGR